MKGFSLIEVLVSIFIVLLAVLFLGRALIFSLSMFQDSSDRFFLSTSYSNFKQKLISLPFDAEQLLPGEHKKSHPGITIEWNIQDRSSSLKKIILKVYDKKRKKEGYFFNSLLLKRRKK